MARQDALSIYVDDEQKDKLAEAYGNVIENIQKGALSEQQKNKNYSGDPSTGSVEIDRFKNAELKDKGTARTNAKGEKIKNTGKVTINVDTDKEIVEEVDKKDLRLHGAGGIAQMRVKNHSQRAIAYLDREFFACAEKEGKEYQVTEKAQTIAEKLEELIVNVETTVNDWVDGVDRDMLVLDVTPAVYSALSNYIDSVPNSLTGLKDEMFHKVRIYSNHRQTKDAICMIDGAVGQLVLMDQYDMEKIPLDNTYGLELFLSKGTKAVMPDLIKYANIVTTP